MAQTHFYVLIRRDLSPAQQIVQACHAAHESGQLTPRIDEGSLSIVLCQIDSEESLLREGELLKALGIEFVLFREDDLALQATAIATLPLDSNQRKLLSHWKLWR